MSTLIVSPLIDALAATALTLAAPLLAKAPSPIALVAIATATPSRFVVLMSPLLDVRRMLVVGVVLSQVSRAAPVDRPPRRRGRRRRSGPLPPALRSHRSRRP